MSLTNLINELNQEDKPDLIVTPGVEDFLAKQGNIVVNSEELQDKLIDIVSDNSNSVRVGRFGASSRGTCLRAQVFRFTGDVEERTWIDTTLQNLFNDGTWRHIRWQMMCLLGNILTDVETKVTNPKYPNFGGSIDGIGYSEKYGKFGFELKGTSWMPTEVKDIHLMQIHTYFVLDPEIKVFSVVYEDKKTQDYREFVIHPIPEYLSKVKKEMSQLEESAAFKIYPEILNNCRERKGQVYKNCPYAHGCLEFPNEN